MLKASALYIAIIVSLIIAILTGSLITVAYYYRAEYQKSIRYKRLLINMESGINMLLSPAYDKYNSEDFIDLYGEETDSISLKKDRWGIFDLALVRSFTQKDTLKKAFLSGINTETDKDAIYLSDEDRPISVSGATEITGDAVLPKSGIKRAYAEGKPYTGKNMINGIIKTSKRTLPELNGDLVSLINKHLKNDDVKQYPSPETGSHSFFNRQMNYYAGLRLSDIQLQGKIMIMSDTVISISRTAVLKDIVIYAPAVVIEEGFRGTCQIFARDSIVAGKDVVFEYPSCLGVLKPEDSKNQSKIVLGQGNRFSGILFSYEQSRSDLQTLISVGKNSIIKGEIYAAGLVKLDKPVRIDGKVSCNRFIMQTPSTLFENYLIDITLNRSQRSRYYLTSDLFTNTSDKKQVLKWLN